MIINDPEYNRREAERREDLAHLARQRGADMRRRVDARQEKTDRVLREARPASAATQAQIDDLEEKLRRHGFYREPADAGSRHDQAG